MNNNKSLEPFVFFNILLSITGLFYLWSEFNTEFVLAVAALCYACLQPKKPWTLAIIALAYGYYYLWGLPNAASSQLILFLLSCTILLFYALQLLSTQSINSREIYENVAFVGRWCLVIIYFFGFYHKLNTDFLSTEGSCAVAFLQNGFARMDMETNQWLDWMAIIGYLLFGPVTLLLLFSQRFKYVGIVIGIGFHTILGLVEFRFFHPFSVFAITMYVFFLPDIFYQRLGQFYNSLRVGRKTMMVISAAFVVITGCLFYAKMQAQSTEELFAIARWPYMLVAFGFSGMMIAWSRGGTYPPFSTCFIPKQKLVLLIPILLFLYDFSTYFGGPTYNTITMYSNLRTEGNSNHFIHRKVIPILPYQSDLIQLNSFTSESNPDVIYSRFFERHTGEFKALVPTVFDRFMEGALSMASDLEVNYTVNGKPFVHKANSKYEPFYDSWFERYGLDFRITNLASPKPCMH